MNKKLTRQFDILNPRDIKIDIVGAGGIGSTTCLLLAKMGFDNITVHDFDLVEEHNINTQMFKEDDLDRPKVEALRDNVKELTGIEIKINNNKIDKIEDAEVLITALDNMEGRKSIFENSKYNFYIDPRMGGQVFYIYSFYNGDDDRYKKTFFTDEEAEETVCTAKAIAYNTFGIASYVSNIVKRYNNNEDFPFEMIGDYVNLRLHTNY